MTRQNVLAVKFLIFVPNLKLSFIVIVIVFPCFAHSYRCSFTKNMIRRAPLGTIRRPYYSGSGVLRPLISSNALMVKNPISMNCGVWVWTGSSAKFILQHVQKSLLEPSESLKPITLLKMDAESRSSGNFTSTTASIFWVCKTKPGGVDFHLFATCWLALRPQGGKVATIPIRDGEVFQQR